jgi:hypothetical protein
MAKNNRLFRRIVWGMLSNSSIDINEIICYN